MISNDVKNRMSQSIITHCLLLILRHNITSGRSNVDSAHTCSFKSVAAVARLTLPLFNSFTMSLRPLTGSCVSPAMTMAPSLSLLISGDFFFQLRLSCSTKTSTVLLASIELDRNHEHKRRKLTKNVDVLLPLVRVRVTMYHDVYGALGFNRTRSKS